MFFKWNSVYLEEVEDISKREELFKKDLEKEPEKLYVLFIGGTQ